MNPNLKHPPQNQSLLQTAEVAPDPKTVPPNLEQVKLPPIFDVFMKMWDKANPGQAYPLDVIKHYKTGQPVIVWKNRAQRRKEAAIRAKSKSPHPTPQPAPESTPVPEDVPQTTQSVDDVPLETVLDLINSNDGKIE